MNPRKLLSSCVTGGSGGAKGVMKFSCTLRDLSSQTKDVFRLTKSATTPARPFLVIGGQVAMHFHSLKFVEQSSANMCTVYLKLEPGFATKKFKYRVTVTYPRGVSTPNATIEAGTTFSFELAEKDAAVGTTMRRPWSPELDADATYTLSKTHTLKSAGYALPIEFTIEVEIV